MQCKVDVLIVGSGHAGAGVALALRRRKFVGTVAIVSEDPSPPYDRPALSKDYLAGKRSLQQIMVRPLSGWADNRISLFLGESVVRVDPWRRIVATSDKREISYETLVWATGGRARTLTCPGSTLQGIATIRSLADVEFLRGCIDRVKDVVVVGGGYIGLEAAAVFSTLGKVVTVLESGNRVLARVCGVTLSRFYEEEHRARGVDIRLSSSVEAFEGGNGWVSGVRVSSPEGFVAIPADIVIVGIGIEPSVSPLLEAGAKGTNGVAVDALCRTSLPNVYGVGDCAEHANFFAEGQAIRLESVQNATDMADTVAKAISADPAPYCAMPWFWSNQYDIRLQTVGLSRGFEEEIIRGDPREGRFSVIYRRNQRVIALDCVNAARDFVCGKELILSNGVFSPAALADRAVSLREVMNNT